MKKIILIIMSGILVLSLLVACQAKSNQSNKLQVAVSIVPQETFVKAVAGELVDVVTLIPPGSSPANYQPTPKQMTELSESSVYFSVGVPTEKTNIIPNILDLNKEIKVVALADIVDNIYPARYFEDEHLHEEEHSHEGRDPHIWMSPKRVIIMVEAIRDELVALDPENKAIYEENADTYINTLKTTDKEIQATMEKLENKTFIIMHPSMGYFADDYELEMVAIEEDGKETTAMRLQKVIEFAKEENIKVIFYQAEFDNQQAETLASEIDGETLELKPLASNYIENLIKINEVFRSIL